MRRATCSTRFNYFVRFLSLACIIVSFSPSLVSINFQQCFDLFFGSSCGSICEDKLSTNIHSWGKRVSKLFHKSWIVKWIWSWRVCRFWDKLIGNGGVGRVYTRGYIIVEWIFNVYLILTALNASSFGSFELESLKIVNKFYFIERRERTLIRLWLRVHIFFSTTLCPRTQNLHSKIFKYQKGGNLIPSWLKSTLTRTISLFKL